MWPAVSPDGVPANRSLHCAVFTVDIAEFGDLRRGDPVRVHMREAMYRYVVDAFEFAGVPWDATEHGDRGDGILVIVPARFPESVLIDPLLDRLRRGLHDYNRMATEIARIRLRAALHAGQVYHDANGLVGEAVNHTFRLLEADELKRTLSATEAQLAFITSDVLFDTVVRHGQGVIDSDGFREVAVEVKETEARAWIHLPGMGPARVWASEVATAPRPAPGPAHGGFQGFVFNGETHIAGDAVAGDKHVYAPDEAPGVPPAAPDRPPLDAGGDDDHPRP